MRPKPVALNPVEPRIVNNSVETDAQSVVELRDQFAMRALPYCLIDERQYFGKFNRTDTDASEHAAAAASRAYLIADAMLKIRAKL